MKDFSISETNVVMNFSKTYCDTEKQLLASIGLERVVDKYITILEKKQQRLYEHFASKVDSNEEFTKTMIDLFKLLSLFSFDDVIEMNKVYKDFTSSEQKVIEFVDGLYDYWRMLERYAIIQNTNQHSGIQSVGFIDETNSFTNLILSTYRHIEQNILRSSLNVFRQLQAGVNVGIVMSEASWELPKGYEQLKDISFIESVVLRPPFINYPKKNTRVGVYEEVYTNPLSDISIKSEHWFCFPAKIGKSLTYVYFHRDFLNQGVALCNLFELAKIEEYAGKKPDLLYVYGVKNGQDEKDTNFFYDKKNDIYVGYANHCDDIDYFGYMKKMLLTIHNVKMIDNKQLPIHGAMVNIVMKNGKEANVVIIGDSGAGKSESLEAFRQLSEQNLKEIKIIFDDMGTFAIEDGKVVGFGTEIGAFVRLDDLDIGYAYKQMDRAIIMNPNQVNARLIIPVASYSDIIKKYPVDIFLYANNYEKPNEEIVFYDDKEVAKALFVKGSRKAKGTTSETGIVDSYFANPFGPLQRKKQTDKLLDQFFDILYETKIPVGEIYTQLGVDGMEQEGPKKAAVKLFDWVRQNK